MAIMVRINKLYTIRKEILWATILCEVYLEIFKILGTEGTFESFENSLIPSFSTFCNKQIHHSKGLEERNKIHESFFSFQLENQNFGNFRKLHVLQKIKKKPRILFRSSRPFKWCICLLRKYENYWIGRIFEIFENSPLPSEF